MYWPDIDSLKGFYRTPLGGVACRMLRAHIHDLWPDLGSGVRLAEPEYIAGVGYASPYMAPFMEDEEDSSYRLLCVMPRAQGVTRWPKRRKNCAVFSDEKELPFADASLDRILGVHALDNCQDTRQFMRELWRVLKANGKIIVVVPNRRGLWARADNTPFGYGRPFSQTQIKRLFVDTMFLPKDVSTHIYIPPAKSKFILNMANATEKLGKTALKPFGGIIVAEAEKQLYAATSVKEGAKTLTTAFDGG
jgi:SAM-dependent methyltransferase